MQSVLPINQYGSGIIIFLTAPCRFVEGCNQSQRRCFEILFPRWESRMNGQFSFYITSLIWHLLWSRYEIYVFHISCHSKIGKPVQYTVYIQNRIFLNQPWPWLDFIQIFYCYLSAIHIAVRYYLLESLMAEIKTPEARTILWLQEPWS